MRPVNLIPAEERRAGAASRTGPIPYLLIGALVALLGGVLLLVDSSNQISKDETKLTSLESRTAAAEARAQRLSGYTKFQNVARQRTATVYELADSRFDWPRVLRQISLVIPKYVVLVKLEGSAGGNLQDSGEGGGEGSGSNDLVAEIKGPALSLEGCAVNQRRVAALIAALHQVDGVTRIGLGESQEVDQEGEGGSSGSGNCSGGIEFTLAVAFDAAPPSPDGESGEGVTTEAPAEGEGESESSSSESTSETGSETTTTTSVTPPSS